MNRFTEKSSFIKEEVPFLVLTVTGDVNRCIPDRNSSACRMLYCKWKSSNE